MYKILREVAEERTGVGGVFVFGGVVHCTQEKVMSVILNPGGG